MNDQADKAVELTYRKSSFSKGENDCVEVADLSDGSRMVRHSKHPELPAHHYTASEWAAFIAGVKRGEFD